MSNSEQKPRRVRGLMLFVLGGLVGANATYYLMNRRVDPARPPLVVDTPQTAIGDSSPSAARLPPRGAPTVLPAPVASMRGTPPAPASTSSVTSLQIPVQGIEASQLSDTFTDTRSAGRSHDAIDIMAPAGTPVLAVADGHVEKLFTSKLGGLTIYEFNSDNTLAYYYAHLERYADGLAEQQAVKRGQLLGYVGSTGDASPEAPHLHFAISVLGPEKQWWKGEAVNPYPQLGGTPH